jgi:hypothetical protein
MSATVPTQRAFVMTSSVITVIGNHDRQPCLFKHDRQQITPKDTRDAKEKKDARQFSKPRAVAVPITASKNEKTEADILEAESETYPRARMMPLQVKTANGKPALQPADTLRKVTWADHNNSDNILFKLYSQSHSEMPTLSQVRYGSTSSNWRRITKKKIRILETLPEGNEICQVSHEPSITQGLGNLNISSNAMTYSDAVDQKGRSCGNHFGSNDSMEHQPIILELARRDL